eukprot:TRINITY_DN5781_c0_g1_i2.p1 TRINITY_DN5781_c0_g1~~TRINITY_DN5781_c0_g1_i2.p1  ORF type:complete len:440 (+),score=100.75 TRINITY_DN5781_c0_g1_i2:394-1713(+)
MEQDHIQEILQIIGHSLDRDVVVEIYRSSNRNLEQALNNVLTILSSTEQINTDSQSDESLIIVEDNFDTKDREIVQEINDTPMIPITIDNDTDQTIYDDPRYTASMNNAIRRIDTIRRRRNRNYIDVSTTESSSEEVIVSTPITDNRDAGTLSLDEKIAKLIQEEEDAKYAAQLQNESRFRTLRYVDFSSSSEESMQIDVEDYQRDMDRLMHEREERLHAYDPSFDTVSSDSSEEEFYRNLYINSHQYAPPIFPDEQANNRLMNYMNHYEEDLSPIRIGNLIQMFDPDTRPRPRYRTRQYSRNSRNSSPRFGSPRFGARYSNTRNGYQRKSNAQLIAEYGQYEGDLNSYESNLELADQIGHVNIGANSAQINSISKLKYQANNETIKEEQCMVCLCEWEEGDILKRLNCGNGHCYHSDCIDTWLKRRKTCPICNIEINL